jgi:putative phage-type endonuclease
MILTFDNRLDWLEARKDGLGGSDIAAVMGLDSYTTPFQVYWDKIHPVKDKKPSNAMRRGQTLEPFIVDLFKEAMPDLDVIYEPNKFEMVVDDDRPYIRGTRDGYYLTQESVPGILECKSTSGHNQHIWFNGVPPKYEIQTKTYMMLYDYDEGYIAYLIDDVFLYTPVRLNDMYRNLIVFAAEKFWTEHILKNVPPDATTLDDIKHAYLDVIKESFVNVDVDFLDAITNHNMQKDIVNASKNYAKTEENKLEELERIIRDKFGRYEYAIFENNVVARLQSWGRGRRLNYRDYEGQNIKPEDIIEKNKG